MMLKYIVHIAWRADFIFDDPTAAINFADTAAAHRYYDEDKQDDDEIKITIKMVGDVDV